jgi:hypothetical protein
MAKRGAAKEAEVIDVTENVELVQSREDGSAIHGFVGGRVSFFNKAQTLERHAKSNLQTAATWPPPKTAEEDVQIQTFCKQVSAHRKAIAEHWEITSVIHRFHRRLTAARDRGIQADERAAEIANGLHNRYVEDERRKAQLEEDRRRREAEERARRDRQAELDRLEAEAVKAEEASPALSEREELFRDYIVAGLPQQDAARRAGYKDPLAASARLMGSDKIRNAITAKQQAMRARQQADAVKASPVAVETPAVRPNIERASGASDRTTHGAEVVDAQALIEAVFEGKYGIPRDVLMVNPVKINEYGRSLHELIDRWPGVRYTKKTRVV